LAGARALMARPPRHRSRRDLAKAASFGFALALWRPARASIESLFAPAKDLWPRWAAHDENSNARVEHAMFERLLSRYVVDDDAGVVRFAYARVAPEHRAVLRAYLAALSSTPITRHPRAEQLAYWINLYNAVTIDVVLSHYPVRSILDIDISPGLFARGPWGKKLVTVEGEALSLNDIEHRILRPIWHDARIHYGVNCASIGCPNLQRTAFTAATADRLLDEGAAAYVNHRRGAHSGNGGLVVSKIYDWYQEDFGGSERGVIAHLRRYADARLAPSLAATRIERYEYDWALNDAYPRF
jgi:hypothetical protein